MSLAHMDKTSGGQVQSGRLETRLNRLATDQRRLAAERATLPAEAKARMRALIAEVDETVLPRILIVQSASGEAGRLIVSHRRLIDVILPGEAPASADPAKLAQRAARGIAALAELPGPLSLTAIRRDAMPARAETACSVHALERALGLASAPEAFARLIQRMEPLALARLAWKGDPAAGRFSGQDIWRGALETYAARQSAALGARKSRIGPTRTEGLAIPLSGDHVLLLANLDEQGFAAILPRDAGLEALAGWQGG